MDILTNSGQSSCSGLAVQHKMNSIIFVLFCFLIVLFLVVALGGFFFMCAFVLF